MISCMIRPESRKQTDLPAATTTGNLNTGNYRYSGEVTHVLR